MKTHIVSSAAALFLLLGVSQAVTQDIIIAPEQEVIVREYVKKKPVASLNLPGIELNVGSSVPEDVELYAIDEVPDAQYRYVVVDNRTVLVEPSTRRIIRVLD